MSEQSVLAAVAAELERLGRTGKVHASANDGVVTLTGRVADEAERRLVVQELLRLPQVGDIRDELELAPPAGETADQLRALLAQDGIDARGLVIEAAGGVVTLKGSAQSWFDRDAAERLAWALPGVRQVINQAEIPPGEVDADLEPGVGEPPAP